MPDAAMVVGYVAGAFSVGAFVPQVVKVVRTRDTKSLATPMWIAEVVTFGLWSVYGGLIGQWPVIVTNVLCGIAAVIILGMKLTHK